MSVGHLGHDDRLLDALDEIERQSYAGNIWRAVREGRSVFDGSRGGGRWNRSELSVLYSALDPNGAIAEIHFHIGLGQSVFPSKMRHKLFELSVKTDETLVFASLEELIALGVSKAKYTDMLYSRTQEIASAAAFMGFDGIISPSARYKCQNLILFLDSFNLENMEVVSEKDIDWPDWRAKNPKA